MKKITLIGFVVLLALASCNNNPPAVDEATTVSAEDSTAYENKVSSEDIVQQAEDLDKEVDSLINSLK